MHKFIDFPVKRMAQNARRVIFCLRSVNNFEEQINMLQQIFLCSIKINLLEQIDVPVLLKPRLNLYNYAGVAIWKSLVLKMCPGNSCSGTYSYNHVT